MKTSFALRSVVADRDRKYGMQNFTVYLRAGESMPIGGKIPEWRRKEAGALLAAGAGRIWADRHYGTCNCELRFSVTKSDSSGDFDICVVGFGADFLKGSAAVGAMKSLLPAIGAIQPLAGLPDVVSVLAMLGVRRSVSARDDSWTEDGLEAEPMAKDAIRDALHEEMEKTEYGRAYLAQIAPAAAAA